MSRPTPPKPARFLIRAALPGEHGPAYLADLDERFERRVARDGVPAARRWYWRQARGFVARVPADRSRRALRRARERGLSGACASLLRDVGYAARTLRARPGFTVPAVLILAIAIAANTAVLSIVDNVMLRGLPVEDADSIALLWNIETSRVDPRVPVSYNHYRAWEARDELFEQVMAMDTRPMTVSASEYPVGANGMLVTANAFDMLGLRPAIGRPLLPADDVSGAPRVAVLSNAFWRRHFGADPDIVGRTVLMSSQPTTVVGVMAEDAWFYDPYMWARSMGERETAQVDVWVPLHTRNWEDYDVDYPALRVFARLHDGVGLQEAQAARSTARAARALEDAETRYGVGVVSLKDEVLGDTGPRLWLLQGAVTLLVLVACVNVMSLVLAKASATRPELAVRAALGAGRGSLVRLALAESTLLGIAGGTLGLAAASSMTSVLVRIAPRDLPLAHRVDVDLRIAVATLAISITAGALAGLVPAMGLDFRTITEALRSGSRGVAGSRRGNRARFGLVALEVSLTVVLIIGAAVMMRSFVGVVSTDPGFDADSVLTFFVGLEYVPGEGPNREFYPRLLEDLRGVPGVEAAAATTHMPFSNWGISPRVVTRDGDDPETAARVDGRWVTEDYFDVMDTELRAGRAFTTADIEGSERVAIVNEAFAEQLLDTLPEDVGALVGRTVSTVSGSTLVPHRIVGVAENVKHSRLYEDDRPMLYRAFRQAPTTYLRFVVRTSGDPMALAPTVRTLAAQIDGRQALKEMYPLATLIDQSLAEERFYLQLLAAFGLVAFGVAALGIYGSVSYGVRLRLREVGVRVAFGAQPRRIRAWIVGRGMAPVALGIVAGTFGAVGLVRGLEGLVHGISPLDPLSFVLASAAFALVAATACAVPAHRAARIDPIEILRSE